ncbi:hypothetical protein M407DRAFT_26204 [Tulasnella calospora MUT 4182]|uniref:Uncharacterized protein n=1 Tax=Tulasnella calospora MUT 4182 TaxID=1051891 RepID=A0A0C3QG58_9AGAM|nr:hypothetical protein M407DRAFT_26204 [Tulasnella calospora MUT 4182]
MKILQRLKRALCRGVKRGKKRVEGSTQHEQGHQADPQPTQDVRTTAQNDAVPGLTLSNTPNVLIPPHSLETAPTARLSLNPSSPGDETAQLAAPNVNERVAVLESKIAMLKLRDVCMRGMLGLLTQVHPSTGEHEIAEARLVAKNDEDLRVREMLWEERERGFAMEETISFLKCELRLKEQTYADHEAELLDLKRHGAVSLAVSIRDALQQDLIYLPRYQRCLAAFESSLESFLRELCAAAERRQKATEEPKSPKA